MRPEARLLGNVSMGSTADTESRRGSVDWARVRAQAKKFVVDQFLLLSFIVAIAIALAWPAPGKVRCSLTPLRAVHSCYIHFFGTSVYSRARYEYPVARVSWLPPPRCSQRGCSQGQHTAPAPPLHAGGGLGDRGQQRALSAVPQHHHRCVHSEPQTTEAATASRGGGGGGGGRGRRGLLFTRPLPAAAAVFFITGLALKTDELLASLRQPGGMVYGFVAILGVTPCLGFALREIPLTPPAFAGGKCAACACTSR